MIIASIRDNVAETYNALVLFETEAAAVRAFNEIQDKPEFKDLTLWKVGDYDIKTGEVTANRKRLAEGADV